MNQSIQATRAVAAILVVAMHIANIAAAGQAPDFVEQLALRLRYVGHFGVDIFFVVSGYIITLLLTRRSETSPAEFAARRIARIYPLFWLTLAAMLFVPALPAMNNTVAALMERPQSLLLAHPTPVHPVAWTLVYEMHFYLVATLCLLAGRHSARALLMWCALQAGLVLFAGTLVPQYQFFTPLSLEFCLGVLLAFAIPKVRLPKPLAWAALALALAAIAGGYFGGDALAFDQPLRLIFWGLPAALFVWAALSYELIRTRPHRLLAAAGDASYSLYMWHLPVLAVAFWFLDRNIQTIGDFGSSRP